MAADKDDVGVRLGDAGGDGADAGLGHELHANTGARVDLLEVVNQLGQILDGIDVVMRRRRDERDAGHRVAELGDVRTHLVTGQLAALAGLGTLGHLDLDLHGAGQIGRRDAETVRWRSA